MSAKRPFSKKNATRYALVHRAQNDPFIHDENASSQIFATISGPSKKLHSGGISSGTSSNRGDLEQEFNLNGEQVPINEEVAAEHGIRFNDKYDYLQHLRDLGEGGEGSAWIEATSSERGKGRGKQRLEDALRDMQLNDELDVQSQGGMSAFGAHRPRVGQDYQEQQDVPDEIAGFQPDMDPRLREVLDALDDDAYVDDNDDELFGELAGEGDEEVDRDIWETMKFGGGEDEDGWQSDDTAKPEDGADVETMLTPSQISQGIEEGVPPSPDFEDGAFLEALAKQKISKGTRLQQERNDTPSVAPSAAMTGATGATGRKKKRKGALTSSTGFSMTSSALARTEAMSTLDSRFDRVLDSYMDEIDEGEEDDFDDNVSAISGLSKMTSASKMSSTMRSDIDDEAPSLVSNSAFTSAMDEYLKTAGKKGKKMKKGGRQGMWGQQNGIDQLDEIRRSLGPARIGGKA